MGVLDDELKKLSWQDIVAVRQFYNNATSFFGSEESKASENDHQSTKAYRGFCEIGASVDDTCTNSGMRNTALPRVNKPFRQDDSHAGRFRVLDDIINRIDSVPTQDLIDLDPYDFSCHAKSCPKAAGNVSEVPCDKSDEIEEGSCKATGEDFAVKDHARLRIAQDMSGKELSAHWGGSNMNVEASRDDCCEVVRDMRRIWKAECIITDIERKKSIDQNSCVVSADSRDDLLLYPSDSLADFNSRLPFCSLYDGHLVGSIELFLCVKFSYCYIEGRCCGMQLRLGRLPKPIFT